MDITMTAVKSSNIAAIGYSESDSVLRVQFHVGGTYDYLDVPKPIYDALLSVPSLGKYLHAEVKPHYTVRKVL